MGKATGVTVNCPPDWTKVPPLSVVAHPDRLAPLKSSKMNAEAVKLEPSRTDTANTVKAVKLLNLEHDNFRSCGS